VEAPGQLPSLPPPLKTGPASVCGGAADGAPPRKRTLETLRVVAYKAVMIMIMVP